MYYFQVNNGISLYNGKKEILKNIQPWVNTPLWPWTSKPRWPNTPSEDRIPLLPKNVTETAVEFESESGAGKMTLSVREENGCFAIFACGSYNTAGTLGHGTHLSSYKGLGFDFDVPHTGNYVDAFLRDPWWQAPYVGKKLSDLKPRTQSLFVKQGKTDKMYLLTTCHKDYKTEIFPSGKVASLVAHSNTILNTIDECVLLGACGKDEYALPEQTVAYGMKLMEKPGLLRKKKKYPEVFEYLGWCSWDAFHTDVSEEKLMQKAQEFRDKEIPVRWMIIDDMWGDVDSIDRKTMHGRSLNDWEADPIRFPNGLKGAVTHIKDEYGLKIGIWHPFTGYWAGVNPLGKLAKTHGDLLEYIIPGKPECESFLMHSFDRKKATKYYDLQHAFYKDCGIDFTKIDNQSHAERYCHHKGTIGACVGNLHYAIEKAAKKYYNGALINCMGMAIENFWSRGYSNVNRFSGDFWPENRKWFIQHLLQCSYNSLTQGTVFTGDWDMWWSDDAQAKKNAVLRSMSGGPIYMSDELNRSIKSVIMPTVFADGRIIRLPDPAVPTRDCMFEDTEHCGKIYKVFNKIGKCGVLAAFNMDENEVPVTGTVSPADVDGLKPGKYCVYDWFKQEAVVMNYDETAALTLENYDDFRLLLIVPIEKGKAVIGLNEKYMSPATVKHVKGGVEVLDDGTLTVYAEEAPAGFTLLSGNLYSKAVQKGEIVVL